MYKFIQSINRARSSTKAASQPQTERYADQEVYAFSRGALFAAFSSKQDRQVKKTITYHPYTEGQTICNIFYATDCLKITGGKFDLYLNYGEVKIFVPK
jgi:alpha-amylase